MSRAVAAAIAGALALALAPAARADDGVDGSWVSPQPSPRPHARRDVGEIVLLYFTTIGWGGASGVFIDGLTQAGNPYAGATPLALLLAPALGGAGVALPALIENAYHHRRGVAQTITTSTLLGLGEGLALNEYFSNRAVTSFHSYTKDAAWVFGGSSVGLATGLVVAAFVHTTPGRAAWVATTGIFGGLFAASLAGIASRPAGYPNPEFDREGIRNVGVTAAIGGAAGIAGGLATAAWLSPSALRVHIVDLAWIAGMALPGLACVDHCTTQATFALMGTGGAVGFGSALALTSLLKHARDTGDDDPPSPPMIPFATPLPGGGVELGLGGAL